jgi:FkbM family methyltransferase
MSLFLTAAKGLSSLLPKKTRAKLHWELKNHFSEPPLPPQIIPAPPPQIINNTIIKPFISNGKHDVCHVNSVYGSFFAVLNGNIHDDNIHAYFREGQGVPVSSWIFDEFFKEGTFLDLGANIGAYSLLMASKGHRCIAFEAAPENAYLLRKSAALNDFNIEVCEKAVSGHTGVIKFLSLNQFGFVITDVMDGHTVQEGYGNQIYEVPCVALDDLIGSTFSDSEKIGFIKMDIEGSEVVALKGMRELLAKNDFPPIFMEINPWTLFLLNETPYSLFKVSSEIGYTAYKIVDHNLLAVHSHDRFHIESQQDVLLLKDVPKSCSVVPNSVPTTEQEIEWIINKINTRDTWLHHEHRILYNLKDFPEYYNEPGINNMLSEIVSRGDNPLMTDKALGWFRQVKGGTK